MTALRRLVASLVLLVLSAARTSGQTAGFATPPEPTPSVLLQEGAAQHTLVYMFNAPQDTPQSDLSFTLSSSNPDVLDPATDALILPPVPSADNVLNVSVVLDLSRWPGSTALLLRATTPAATLATASPVLLTAVGLAFYTEPPDAPRLLLGPEAPLVLPARTGPDAGPEPLQVPVFVQFADGSNSNTALSVSLNSAALATDPLPGSTAILSALPGWATRPPALELSLAPRRNGSADIAVEWPALVAGTQFAGEAFSTTLPIHVVGVVPPGVASAVVAGRTMTLTVVNVPAEPDAWSYALELGSDTGLNASFVSAAAGADGVADVVFQLPVVNATVGSVSWALLISLPDGSTVAAVDETDPPFNLTILPVLALEMVYPSTLPVEGRVPVTLSGDLAAGPPSELAVIIDGVPLPPSAIVRYSATSLTFLCPPAVLGEPTSVNVTVSGAPGESNAVTMQYGSPVRLDTIDPANGTVAGGTIATLSGTFDAIGQADPELTVVFGTEQLLDAAVVEATQDTIKFITPALPAVRGTPLEVHVSVILRGASSPARPYVYDPELRIDALTPSTASESGGAELRLIGVFHGLEAGATVYIGGAALSGSSFAANRSEIVLNLPPRAQAGRAYAQSVWVTSGRVASNRARFVYDETNPATGIEIISGDTNSTDDSTVVAVANCTVGVFRANLSRGARAYDDLAFLWRLEVSGEDLLAGSGLPFNGELVRIPAEMLGQPGTKHTLTLGVEVGGQTRTAQPLILTRGVFPRLAVHLSEVLPRTLTTPPTGLTVSATVQVPNCGEGLVAERVAYNWSLFGAWYTPAPTAEVAKIGPTWLGQAFYVPPSELRYGTHELSLEATSVDSVATLSTTGSTNFVVERRALVVQINGRQESQLVGGEQDVVLDGGNSYDPDPGLGRSENGISFAWSCEYGPSAEGNQLDFANSSNCPDDLLTIEDAANPAITVSAAALKSMLNSSTTVLFRYSLVVENPDDGRSGQAAIVLVLQSDSASKRFTTLDNIVVSNNRSEDISLDAVSIHEDVIISPSADAENVTWDFAFLQPKHSAPALLASNDSLRLQPGFFNVGAGFGRRALALRAGALTAQTRYTLQITARRPGYVDNRLTITFKTAEQPLVTLARPQPAVGRTGELFTLTATSNLGADAAHQLLFFATDDSDGTEVCLAGCAPGDIALFRPLVPGTYSVRADLFDAGGFARIASSEPFLLVVAGEPPTSTFLLQTAARAVALGDRDTLLAALHALPGADDSDLDSTDAQSLADAVAAAAPSLADLAAQAIASGPQADAVLSVAERLVGAAPEAGAIRQVLNAVQSLVTRVPLGGAPGNVAATQAALEALLSAVRRINVLQTRGTGSLSLRRRRSNVERRALTMDLFELAHGALATALAARTPCAGGAATGQANAPAFGSVAVVRTCGASSPGTVGTRRADRSAGAEWCDALTGDGDAFVTVARLADYTGGGGAADAGTLAADPDSDVVSVAVGALDGRVRDVETREHQCVRVRFGTHALPRDAVGVRMAPRKSWGRAGNAYAPTLHGLSVVSAGGDDDEGPDADDDDGEMVVELRAAGTGVFAVGPRSRWSGLRGLSGVFGVVAAVACGVLLATGAASVGASGAAALATGHGWSKEPHSRPVQNLSGEYVARDVFGRGTVGAEQWAEEVEYVSRSVSVT